jgi:hypothetical protein
MAMMAHLPSIARVKKPGGARSLGLVCTYATTFFGQTALEGIDARMIDQYKALKRPQKHQYRVGYGAHTINNHLSVLRRVLEKAVEYKHIRRTPSGRQRG